MYHLQGKSAIVTGSGRHKGIGEAIVLRLAAEGCRVVVSDIGKPQGEAFSKEHIGTTEEMEEIAVEARRLGAEVITVACDVRDEQQVENLLARTVEAFGRVDILVNNAGVGYLMEPFTEFKESSWDAVLDVNLKGAFLCSKHAARQMIKQGSGGVIINIASQAAKSGFPYAAAYTASKHGLVGLTRSNAVELGKYKIRVNAVCPQPHHYRFRALAESVLQREIRLRLRHVCTGYSRAKSIGSHRPGGRYRQRSSLFSL